MGLLTENESMSGCKPQDPVDVVRNVETGRNRSFLGAIVVGALPWFVIAGLLVGAFTIRPGGIAKAVAPPPISAQDHFYDVAHPGPDVLWMVGMLGKIVRSEDGGQSWVEQRSMTKRNLQSIAAWNPREAVAVGDNGIVLVTQDGGNTWKKETTPRSKISNKFMRVRILKNGTAWIVGTMGAVLESTDHGHTWARRVPVHDVSRMDIAGVGKHIWVAGEFGQILASDDGGESWHKEATGIRNTLNGIAFRNAEDGVAVGLQGVILRTSDGGQSWHQVKDITQQHLFAVRWNGKQWAAVGANGVVATAGPDAEHWTARQIAQRDFAWHTGISPAAHGWYLAGANSGVYRDGHWNRFSARSDQ